MNIQITDKRLIENLQRSTFATFEFGAKLYGLDSESSDIDEVAIYAKPTFFHHSFLWEHHTLQVATRTSDTIYSTLQEFVRNLLTGDSLYNFEVIHSDAVKNSRLDYLYENAHNFYNFTTIRAYLGFARRDLKHGLKDGKRLSHAVRCYHAAEMIFNERFYCNNLRDVDRNLYQLVHDLKFDKFSGSRKELLEEYSHKVETLRQRVRQAFDNKDHHFHLHRFMDTKDLKQLDNWVVYICRTMWYSTYEKSFTINSFYNALENGIQYKNGGV